MNLDDLPTFRYQDNTERPQRFLWSAYDSVWGILENLDVVRQLDRDLERGLRGRLSHSEADMLRAAITFTGAGLDATLKELVKETLPAVLEKSTGAQEQFRDFVERHLTGEPPAMAKKLSGLLAVADARKALIDRYVADLTGDSLQSSDQLFRTAKSLGISSTHLKDNKAQLDQFFRARNEIVHELDLQHTAKRGDSSRRSRKLKATVADCNLIFKTAQTFIDEVALLLDPEAQLMRVASETVAPEPRRKAKTAAAPTARPVVSQVTERIVVLADVGDFGVPGGVRRRGSRSKVGGGGGN
jgi:hypothetical protein